MARAILDGVGLEYQVTGDGPETVFLLNGIAMSISHWKPIVERLVAEGYRVVAHDFRGQLLSDRPVMPYSLSLHARDLAGLMHLLDIKRAHIMGTSYGAEVALTFALEYPALCASVASIDGVSEYDAVLGAAVESWKAAALADPRVFYKAILPWNYSAAYLAANREVLTKREEAIAGLPRDWFEAFARLCDAFMEIKLTDSLYSITCPALVVVAERDILKHKGYSDIIASRLRYALYEKISDAGHAVVIEQPDAVATIMVNFLGALRDTAEA
jgi:3-oxoadipate enol-lactonase